MQTLKILFWNVLFLTVFGALCFAGLEFYLRTYQSFSTETVSAVGVPIFEKDGLNTYRHRPGSSARNGYGIPAPEIKINNLGLRDSVDFEGNKDNQKNLLLIGDSFTFGTGVDQSETFGEQLQGSLNPKLKPLSFDSEMPRGGLSTSLNLPSEAGTFALSTTDFAAPDWQVWNAGHIGYSVGQYYLLLKKYADLMPLDTVVINIFVANDITELRRKNWLKNNQGDLAQVQDLKVFANADNKLESRTSVVPKSRAWHWLNQRMQVLKYKLELEDPEFADPTLTWPVFLDKQHPAWDPKLPRYWTRFFQGLQLIDDYARDNNIETHFVLIPMDVQVDESYKSKYARLYFDDDAWNKNRPQTEIMNFCAARQLSCLDLLPVFRAREDRADLFFNYNADPHFDVLGHTVTAKLIADYLERPEL